MGSGAKRQRRGMGFNKLLVTNMTLLLIVIILKLTGHVVVNILKMLRSSRKNTLQFSD